MGRPHQTELVNQCRDSTTLSLKEAPTSSTEAESKGRIAGCFVSVNIFYSLQSAIFALNNQWFGYVVLCQLER